MESELLDFISHLDDDVQFSPYQQLNEMWKELETYFDQKYFDIDEYLDELLPDAQPLPSTIDLDIPSMNESKAAATTVAELFQSFALPETFFDNLISTPSSEDKCVVTDEILMNSIRSHEFTFTGRHYEHPYETLSTAIMSVTPIRNDFFTDMESTTQSATLKASMISSDIDWFSVLRKQHVHPGTTAEEIAESVLQSKSQKLPTRTEIVNVITRLFEHLNSYVDILTVEFGDHKFFDAPQFDAITSASQEKVLSRSNTMSAPIRDVLQLWMGKITDTFVHINDDRRRVEEKVSEQIIDRAVELYRGRLMSVERNEDMSTVCKEQSDIVCQGIRHVYSNCGLTFTANVLRELEKRLERENCSTGESNLIRTTSPTATQDPTVLMELLVSEYASNINQKGLKCAGISTLEQFDDVNATCLKDILHIFDRKTKEVSFAEQKAWKNQLISNLEVESNIKRSEFRRRSVKVSVPSGVSSARSQSIGIHFGVETISVSCFDRVNNSFRTIYGPVANVVSFVRGGGVAIGQIPNVADARSLNMEQLLNNADVGDLYDTKYHGELSLDSIIALMLMYIDEMVKNNLHTVSRVKYAVAIPSCLNETMQHIFKTAFNIADINCSLVREQCALTINFISEHHQAITKNNDEFIITMIEKENNACDSVMYGIIGRGQGDRTVKVLSASGSEAKSRYLGFSYSTGVKCELEKMKDKRYGRNRFPVCCPDQESAIKEIKNQFSKSKFHPLKCDSKKLADGAALLSNAAIDGNASVCGQIDLRHLTSIKRLAYDGANYRLTHINSSTKTRNLKEISTQLRIIIDNHLKNLAERRAATKQLLMGKMKDLEGKNLSEDEKEENRRSLEKQLKAVDDEFTNNHVIADDWKQNQF